MALPIVLPVSGPQPFHWQFVCDTTRTRMSEPSLELTQLFKRTPSLTRAGHAVTRLPLATEIAAGVDAIAGVAGCQPDSPWLAAWVLLESRWLGIDRVRVAEWGRDGAG